MVSRVQPRPDAAIAEPVLTQAQSLVLLWDRAEDWAVPRIPPSQLRVLTALDRRGSMNLTALARELGAIPSSASRLCDRLEASGLLTREVSAGSRREVTLSVSREGRRRLDGFASARQDDFALVLDLMTPQGRASLLDGLRQFSEAAAEVLESEALEA